MSLPSKRGYLSLVGDIQSITNIQKVETKSCVKACYNQMNTAKKNFDSYKIFLL